MMSKNELMQEYVVSRKSCRTIASERGVAERTIHSWLVKHKIPRRDNTKPGNKKDMKDVKVGNLTVIEQAPIQPGRQASWVVECRVCKVRFNVQGWKIRHRQIGGCKQCGKHPNFRGCGDIYRNYWTKLQKNAKDRRLDFTITIEEGWEIFLAQGGKCALSGVEIVFERSKGAAAEKTASLDRIDSTKGYVPGNVQWVHKTVNKLKGNFVESDLIRLCKLIAEYRKEE